MPKNLALYHPLVVMEGANPSWRLRNEHLLADSGIFAFQVADDLVDFRQCGFALGGLAFVLLGTVKKCFDLTIAVDDHFLTRCLGPIVLGPVSQVVNLQSQVVCFLTPLFQPHLDIGQLVQKGRVGACKHRRNYAALVGLKVQRSGVIGS